MPEPVTEAAIELAEAALDMLHQGTTEHPTVQARKALRAEREGPLEDRYLRALMVYRARKARHTSIPRPQGV